MLYRLNIKILLPALLLSNVVFSQGIPHFRGLSVVTDKTAWISGSKGMVLRTQNGGATWDTINPPGYQTRDFRDIHAWNSKKAIVMSSGDSAVLLYTANGGRTWKVIASDNSAGVFWDAIDVKKRSVLLVGDGKAIGQIYLSRRIKKFSTLNLLFFKEDENGIHYYYGSNAADTFSFYAASGSNVQWTGKRSFAMIPINKQLSLFYFLTLTHNKFKEPVRKEIRMIGEYSSLIPFKIEIAGGAYSFVMYKENVAVVGGSYLKPQNRDSVAFYSTNSGYNWSLCDSMPGGYRSCVIHNNSGKIWICTGTSGTDISLNNGKSWSPLHIKGYNVCAFSKHYLWLAGNKGSWLKVKIKDLKP